MAGSQSKKQKKNRKLPQKHMTLTKLFESKVIKLYFNMKESLSQEALVHVGVWCLGEFGDHLVSGKALGPDNQPIRVTPGVFGKPWRNAMKTLKTTSPVGVERSFSNTAHPKQHN